MSQLAIPNGIWLWCWAGKRVSGATLGVNTIPNGFSQQQPESALCSPVGSFPWVWRGGNCFTGVPALRVCQECELGFLLVRMGGALGYYYYAQLGVLITSAAVRHLCYT